MKPEIVRTIIDLVEEAHPTRCRTSLDRRVTKLLEEIGEVAQAFISVTALNNEKKKTWVDVREEAADVLIVALDIALTTLDDTLFRTTLEGYVLNQLHRINMGFHSLLWRISHLNANFAFAYASDPATARQFSADMVRYAFALNALLAEDESDQLVAEVKRKLKKWKRAMTPAT